MANQWRCLKCGTLLGVWRNDRLHLQYKQAQYLVKGSILAVCRNCSTANEAESGKPVEPVLRG